MIDGEIDALEPAGTDRAARRCRNARLHRTLGRSRTDRRARASARSRISAKGNHRDRALAPPLPVVSPRSPRWRIRRRSTTLPKSRSYMLERAREVDARRLIPVSAVTKDLAGRELVDFAAMAAAGARLYSDDGIPIDDEAILVRAFREAAQNGFAISLHEEDRALTGHGALQCGRSLQTSRRRRHSGDRRNASRASRPRDRRRRRCARTYRARLDR